ncbi:uncharacterized protein EI90DRAFT_3019020 [Cantharellus anzutake]|uniref:uncharacterized protein n=1 Tax=Cantharellus anzutake TaxID=1750568 RepID=UPI001908B45B|nr:uncharacterized protein EI90DRAFT_3019020 [Cantharellus anzutake]KAF8325564.1 hypothetical protein EI90DRAFT_3019020 [Cantharellus anzutake]
MRRSSDMRSTSLQAGGATDTLSSRLLEAFAFRGPFIPICAWSAGAQGTFDFEVKASALFARSVHLPSFTVGVQRPLDPSIPFLTLHCPVSCLPSGYGTTPDTAPNACDPDFQLRIFSDSLTVRRPNNLTARMPKYRQLLEALACAQSLRNRGLDCGATVGR